MSEESKPWIPRTDPFDNPEGFVKMMIESVERAVQNAIADNDRLNIPSCSGILDGKIVYSLRGEIISESEAHKLLSPKL